MFMPDPPTSDVSSGPPAAWRAPLNIEIGGRGGRTKTPIKFRGGLGAEHGAARHAGTARRGTARERHFICIGGTEEGTARQAGAARGRGAARHAVGHIVEIWEPRTARRGALGEWTPLSGAALALFFQAQRLKTRAPNVHPARRAHCPLARPGPCAPLPRPDRAARSGEAEGPPAPGRERGACAVPGRGLRASLGRLLWRRRRGAFTASPLWGHAEPVFFLVAN